MEAKLAVNDEEVKKEAEVDNKAKIAEEKEAKKLRNRMYRETVKALIAMCVEKMPGSRYDKFFVDELVKKYPVQDKLDQLIEEIKAITAEVGSDFVSAFAQLVDKEAYEKQ